MGILFEQGAPFRNLLSMKFYTVPLIFLRTVVHAQTRRFARNLSYSQSTDGACYPVSRDPLDILTDPHQSYKTIVEDLEIQGKKSVLLKVQVPSSLNEEFLQTQIKKYLKSISYEFFSKADKNVGEKTRYYILELINDTGVKKLTSENEDGFCPRVIDVSDRLLSSRRNNKNLDKLKVEQPQPKLSDKLRKCTDMEDQIHTFFKEKAMTSMDLRKKIFLATLLDDVICHQFGPSFKIFVYGTSMTPFSTQFSDLDLSMSKFGTAKKGQPTIKTIKDIPFGDGKEFDRLMKLSSLALVEELHKVLPKHLPHVSKTQVIRALVPILKFEFAPFGMSVDISLDNNKSVQMGWCTNMMTRCDRRVAPFVFLVRHWAKHRGLLGHGTREYDGLTPFMISCLAYFYLMRLNPAVLPTLKEMTTSDSSSDWFLGNFRTSLVTDIRTIQKYGNHESVSELFEGFLEYFERVDFSKYYFSLSQGRLGRQAMPRNGRGGNLNILSHLQSHNMSIGKNCSANAIENFQRQAVLTSRRLDDRKYKGSGYEDWGLISIFEVDEPSKPQSLL